MKVLLQHLFNDAADGKGRRSQVLWSRVLPVTACPRGHGTGLGRFFNAFQSFFNVFSLFFYAFQRFFNALSMLFNAFSMLLHCFFYAFQCFFDALSMLLIAFSMLFNAFSMLFQCFSLLLPTGTACPRGQCFSMLFTAFSMFPCRHPGPDGHRLHSRTVEDFRRRPSCVLSKPHSCL